jgi:putative ABC transport system substrate-binding protein
MRLPRLTVLAILALALLAAPLFVEAQSAGRARRIAYVTERPGPGPREEAFRQALRDLGYVLGQNVIIEERYSARGSDRLRAVMADLIRLRVEVVLAGGPTVTRAASEASKSIPIVMAQDSDPVASGFAATLARPGGNITGLSILATELNGKRIELLREVVPTLSHLLVLGSSNEPDHARALHETQRAASALGVQVLYREIRGAADIEEAFRGARAERAEAVLVLLSAILGIQRAQVSALAMGSRLPVMWHNREAVEAGVLMAYGVNLTDLFRRSAGYVDKILKGAKPGDLPIEQPTKFELVINLKTAKVLGLTIPTAVLARADDVIR